MADGLVQERVGLTIVNRTCRCSGRTTTRKDTSLGGPRTGHRYPATEALPRRKAEKMRKTWKKLVHGAGVGGKVGGGKDPEPRPLPAGMAGLAVGAPGGGDAVVPEEWGQDAPKP
jgi:hypothetical protein